MNKEKGEIIIYQPDDDVKLEVLGRRWFAFSRLEMKTKDLLGKM